jgi:serine/threonine protein kinase
MKPGAKIALLTPSPHPTITIQQLEKDADDRVKRAADRSRSNSVISPDGGVYNNIPRSARRSISTTPRQNELPTLNEQKASPASVPAPVATPSPAPAPAQEHEQNGNSQVLSVQAVKEKEAEEKLMVAIESLTPGKRRVLPVISGSNDGESARRVFTISLENADDHLDSHRQFSSRAGSTTAASANKSVDLQEVSVITLNTGISSSTTYQRSLAAATGARKANNSGNNADSSRLPSINNSSNRGNIASKAKTSAAPAATNSKGGKKESGTASKKATVDTSRSNQESRVQSPSPTSKHAQQPQLSSRPTSSFDRNASNNATIKDNASANAASNASIKTSSRTLKSIDSLLTKNMPRSFVDHTRTFNTADPTASVRTVETEDQRIRVRLRSSDIGIRPKNTVGEVNYIPAMRKKVKSPRSGSPMSQLTNSQTGSQVNSTDNLNWDNMASFIDCLEQFDERKNVPSWELDIDPAYFQDLIPSEQLVSTSKQQLYYPRSTAATVANNNRSTGAIDSNGAAAAVVLIESEAATNLSTIPSAGNLEHRVDGSNSGKESGESAQAKNALYAEEVGNTQPPTAVPVVTAEVVTVLATAVKELRMEDEAVAVTETVEKPVLSSGDQRPIVVVSVTKAEPDRVGGDAQLELDLSNIGPPLSASQSLLLSPSLSRFRTMLRVGLPPEIVRLRMQEDGIPDQIIEEVFAAQPSPQGPYLLGRMMSVGIESVRSRDSSKGSPITSDRLMRGDSLEVESSARMAATFDRRLNSDVTPGSGELDGEQFSTPSRPVVSFADMLSNKKNSLKHVKNSVVTSVDGRDLFGEDVVDEEEDVKNLIAAGPTRSGRERINTSRAGLNLDAGDYEAQYEAELKAKIEAWAALEYVVKDCGKEIEAKQLTLGQKLGRGRFAAVYSGYYKQTVGTEDLLNSNLLNIIAASETTRNRSNSGASAASFKPGPQDSNTGNGSGSGGLSRAGTGVSSSGSVSMKPQQDGGAGNGNLSRAGTGTSAVSSRSGSLMVAGSSTNLRVTEKLVALKIAQFVGNMDAVLAEFSRDPHGSNANSGDTTPIKPSKSVKIVDNTEAIARLLFEDDSSSDKKDNDKAAAAKSSVPSLSLATAKLKKQLMAPTVCSQEFQRELQALTQLTAHPNIVRLEGIVLSPLCLVLEKLDANLGDSLDNSDWQFQNDPRSRLNILENVVSAVAHMHKSLFMHRDIKSHNVLLCSVSAGMSKGNGNITVKAKLSDFGTAIQLRGARQILNEPCGTSGYTAPEVMYPGNYSLPADIYSLGVLAWGLFSQKHGQNPVTGLDSRAASMKVSELDLPCVCIASNYVFW